ncbi:MAG TPA: amidohydrolase family protein, partial [Bacillota bacterium]|nr:amidohydrolase family protein [Bacillota bacterium]
VELEDALDAYTVGSAYNEFKESKKGRIKPGFLADMVVLDTDIFRCDRGAIYGVVPEMTVIGGEVVYRRK